MNFLKNDDINADFEKKGQKDEKYFELKLYNIGLLRPTTVENENKSVTTTGLDINTLVKVWRTAFNLPNDKKIILYCDAELYKTITKKFIKSLKTIAELLQDESVIVTEAKF